MSKYKPQGGVRGTKAEHVAFVINKISESERDKVKEITMDFSDSIQGIAELCFPKATVVIDCFHIIQRLCEGLEEIRLKEMRKSVADNKRKALAFRKNEERRARQRMSYRKKHPKKRGEKRGRKRTRQKTYRPETLFNGDTAVGLQTRAKYILPQSGEKWIDQQKERAGLVFGLFPRIKEAYSLICSAKSIGRDKRLTSPSSCSDYAKSSADRHLSHKEVFTCPQKQMLI